MSLIGSNGRPLHDEPTRAPLTEPQIREIVRAETVEVMEHYLTQIPSLIEKYMDQLPSVMEAMVTSALTAYDEAKAEKAAHPLATLDQWAERRADEDEATDPAVLVVPGNGTVQ